MASAAEPSATVRPAVHADLEGVVDVLWEVAAEGRWLGTQVPFDREQRRASMAERLSDPAHLILVADDGGKVGGYLQAAIAPYGVAEIGMAILQGWRGRGLGTRLLRAALEWARTAGAHKMALEVWPDNEAAMSLYRKLGFVEEGRRRRHYRRAGGEVRGAVLMGRLLDRETWPLRPATDADGWDLVALIAGCWSEYPGCVMDPHGECPELLAPASAYEARKGRIWVVEGPGYALIGSVAIAGEGPTVELQKLYVARRWRRRGMASHLLGVAEGTARLRGAGRMEAWSDTRFTEAHRFYAAHGYERQPETRELHDLSATVEAHFVKELSRGE